MKKYRPSSSGVKGPSVGSGEAKDSPLLVTGCCDICLGLVGFGS